MQVCHKFLGKSLIVKYDSNDYSFSIEKFDIHELCIKSVPSKFFWLLFSYEFFQIKILLVFHDLSNKKYSVIKVTNLKFNLHM